ATNLGLDGSALSTIGLRDRGGGLVPLAGSLGGKLGALVDLRDTKLPATGSDLDLLATTLRDAINTEQTDPAGRDLNGAVGTALFTGTGAADLNVALSDPRTIAAARGSNLADNGGALAIAAVGDASHAALGGATFDEFFGRVQAQVGSDARAAE